MVSKSAGADEEALRGIHGDKGGLHRLGRPPARCVDPVVPEIEERDCQERSAKLRSCLSRCRIPATMEERGSEKSRREVYGADTVSRYPDPFLPSPDDSFQPLGHKQEPSPDITQPDTLRTVSCRNHKTMLHCIISERIQ